MGFPVFPLRWKDPRTGEVFEGFREAGYYPESFINLLALLGWNPGTEQEVFTLDELVAAFSVGHIHKAAARFDPEKAKWFNAQWLQRQPDESLAARLRVVLDERYGEANAFTSEFLTGCVRLLRPRVQFEHEMPDKGRYLFEDPAGYDTAVLEKKWLPEYMSFFESLAAVFGNCDDFEAATLEAAFKATASAQGLKPGKVLQLLRVLVTGEAGGVDLFPMLSLLGPEKVAARLAKGLSYAASKFVDHG
jgi:glutamyl-tRNA synthetase